MKTVRITRISTDPDHGTFGALCIDGVPFCVTLEPYQMANHINVSCIPTSQYQVRKYKSGTWGKTYKVTSVPGRTGILFHPGNTDDKTEGCILLGSSFGKLYSDRAIMNSGDTFKKFKQAMGFNSFHLTIVEAY